MNRPRRERRLYGILHNTARMKKGIAIHWFGQDLRLLDNPALTEAAKHSQVLPVFILDDESAGEFAMGAASRWWLHHSLVSLNASLAGKLSVYRGNSLEILRGIVSRLQVEAVYWNRCYEPWRIAPDTAIKQHLKNSGIAAESANGGLLWEPWTIKKADGGPFKVFTAFYRRGCLRAEPPRKPLPKPPLPECLRDNQGSEPIEQLGLLPKVRWDQQLEPHWKIGEQSAHERWENFIETGLSNYQNGRNFPAANEVSRLSPHLHFGEISPNQLWYGAQSLGADENIDHFCRELGWREFSHNLLFHNPTLPTKNLQAKFDRFPWLDDSAMLKAWRTGQTGVPMVDAGMRELWQTGYMHNRVRMIAGSFLVKNLRLHWRHGERWFRDTLVDADLANNSASWQWIAGCGADAAPYFRIFNPVVQGRKFDPDGAYIRRFVPEIAKLPNQYLFSPWSAPTAVLQTAGVTLGASYPAPIVDLRQSREAALQAFQSLRTNG